jgi:aconitate hydratase
MDLELVIHLADNTTTIPLLCRIDTEEEIEYLKNGGILHGVLRNLLDSKINKI